MGITELQVPSCLLNGTSVNIQCVSFGFPRPEIVFFRGTEQITPGVAPFNRFEQVFFDTLRLSGARQADCGDYSCEARMGSNVLTRSPTEKLMCCSKVIVFLTSYSVIYIAQPVKHPPKHGGVRS